MRNIINRLILTLLILTCISSVVIPVYADTDGTELQVVEPQKLEIQLGQSWAGVEFTLKTDAGMYPNAIPVDEIGVLKLEIGGSKSYVLSCLQSSIDIPDPDNNTPATLMTLTRDKQNAAASKEKDAKQSETIPVTQIVFLSVGIVLAISALVAIHITSKRHSSDDDDEEDDAE